jgi:tRNA A-37 threonylcarbamoyl transferase component Bud32
VAAFLLVEAVPMRHTLEEWLVPGFPKPTAIGKEMRERLFQELGTFVGRIHGAGFVWPDFHVKHVFAGPAGAGSNGAAWEFCLIDVERMTREAGAGDSGFALTVEAEAGQLGMLWDSVSPFSPDREDMRCFAEGYSKAGRERPSGGAIGPEQRDAASLPVLLSDFFEEEGPRPRLPEDYEHPRFAGLVRAGDIQIEPRVKEILEKAGLGSFREIINCSSGKSLRKPGLQSYRDRVRLELTDQTGNRRVFFLKRYVRPPVREQLRRLWESRGAHGTAWREAHFARELARQGIATLRTVAFGEQMRGKLEQASFVMTAEVRGESLEQLANRAAADPTAVPSWRDRVEIIRQLALITRRLHENGFFHRDLYLCHLFLTRNADGGIVLQLIDLARMIEKPWSGRRWMVKDLASLEYSSPQGLVTRADRVRFLYYYQGDFARRGGIDRGLIDDILSRTRRMARHDVKRGRRIEVGGRKS